jgi:phytoene dehydrogenase-like protein
VPEILDAIIVGAGHNGLVAATLLARGGQRVLVLERGEHVGGAAVSEAPFAGVEARISRYSYLVSLFPRALIDLLGLDVTLRRRSVSSYTPRGDAGVLVCDDPPRTAASMRRTLGSDAAAQQLASLETRIAALAGPAFASLTEPLRSREELRRRVGEDLWPAVFERPLAELLADHFDDELVRGIVATDALIGTFASLADPQLRQNRCFLYHVIGNGTGRWDVPVGGMGALSGALLDAAVAAGADIHTRSAVVAIDSDGRQAAVRLPDGTEHRARHVLANVAPATLAGLLGDPPTEPTPEGCQLKLNLLLARLPRLRDRNVSPAEAFAGTFHVNESEDQLEAAYAQAAAGQIPTVAPCEAYCHTLTDPSILSAQLQADGAHTLTVFGLHMPARLFGEDPAGAKATAVAATLRSLDSVLAEPIEDCLLRGADGEPCLEARTPVELEAELGLPGGHIFHRDLSWPFAESEEELGRWGVETGRANVWVCGAGARRGGGVSGIPGHNAARAVLDA